MARMKMPPYLLQTKRTKNNAIKYFYQTRKVLPVHCQVKMLLNSEKVANSDFWSFNEYSIKQKVRHILFFIWKISYLTERIFFSWTAWCICNFIFLNIWIWRAVGAATIACFLLFNIHFFCLSLSLKKLLTYFHFRALQNSIPKSCWRHLYPEDRENKLSHWEE